MLMIVFKVTDSNDVIGLNTETLELWRYPLDKRGADIFREQMRTNIMPRANFSKTPGIVFGNLISLDSLASNAKNL